MIEIILDTETTGLNAKGGDKIVEIGCVELKNKVRTGRHFHRYINPKREVPMEATRVHGITTQFLLDKPTFADIVTEFLEFIGDGHLVIHNAGFDMGFINHELHLCSLAEISKSRVIDTLNMARKQYPGSPASLDALCKRFGVSLDKRDKHGALIDAELLVEVYINLTGGLQGNMILNDNTIKNNANKQIMPKDFPQRIFPLSEDEDNSHKEFIVKIANSLWN